MLCVLQGRCIKPPMKASLFGDSAVARIASEIDWSKHPLGPVESWDPHLKMAIRIAVNSKFAMFISWGSDRHFFYNDAYSVLMGNKHPTAFGRKFQDIWSEIWDDILPLIESVDAGQSVYLENLKLTMNRKGYDEDAYFTFSYSPIIGDSNNVLGLFCAAQETTKQIIAEQDLQVALLKAEEARKDLYSFFMQAPAPMVILMGEEYRYFLANPPYEKMVGKIVTGKTVGDLFTNEEVGHFKKLLDEVYKNGTPHMGKEMPLKLGDETIYLDVRYNPFRDENGKIKGILAIHQDVTDQVLAKTALQDAVKMRDEFLSIASHELKTPLTSLKLNVNMMRRAFDKGDYSIERIKNFADQTDKQSVRLERLINDMLDISRIKTGRLAITRERFNMYEATEEVIRRMAPQFSAAGMNLPILEGTKEAFGYWDMLRIEQVIMNLLTNTIRYGEKKDVHVLVTADKQNVKVQVKDFGIGIAKQHQENLFEIFQRFSHLNESSGLGLGLFLSKQIVNSHNGNIYVESEPGKGSTFTIELPINGSGDQKS